MINPFYVLIFEAVTIVVSAAEINNQSCLLKQHVMLFAMILPDKDQKYIYG